MRLFSRAPIIAALCLTSCSAQSFIGIMPAVINEPSNRTLRRDILAFGTGTICKELMKRTVPLKLGPDDPSLGRFFPARCDVRSLQNGDLFVELSGTGYAWTNLTKRVGFNANAAIHYEQDLRMDGSTAYVYFRPAVAQSKQFQALMVEESVLPDSALKTFLPGGTPEAFVSRVGDGLLAQQLGEGFTAILESDGDASFALGTVEVGKKPLQAYERVSEPRALYANDRVEVHQNQRDFLGPIEVTRSGALYLTIAVDGAPQVDVQVYNRAGADAWLAQYIAQKQATPPLAPPLFDDTVPMSADGKPVRRLVRVPAGQYYVVIDNTANAGKTAPPNVPGDDRAAHVLVGIEVGDVP